MFNTKNRLIVILGLILVGNSSQVYAYLDPGTGSMLIQMLIGGVVAAIFTIKMYWYQFKTYVKRKLGYPEQEDNIDSSGDNYKEE